MRASVFRTLGLRRKPIVNVFKRHQINIKPNLDGSRSWETPSFKLTQLGCNNECQEGAKLNLDYTTMLAVALAEARKGLAEGGIPIGAAIFDAQGKLLGAGHNRRVQQGDPSLLTVRRITYDDRGRPVEYGTHLYRASRYAFEFRLLVRD